MATDSRKLVEGSRCCAIVIIGAALVVAVAGAQGSRSAVLAIPGHSNANPSIAASGRFVALAWGTTVDPGGSDVVSAVSRDGGRTFATPVRVSDAGGQASLSGEQPPRIALVPRPGQEPALVVVWTARAAAGTRLLSARSDDGGRSFSAPALVGGSDAPGNRGWEATAVDRTGRVVAVWLDHRELAAGAGMPMNHAEHEAASGQPAAGSGSTDGVARAQLSKLFFARVGDAAGARAIAAGVCYCCKTALATGPDGSIYVAWRHVYPGNVRDIAFSVSRDGGRTFASPLRVSDDRWVLDGCPENGPAIAVDAARRVHIVWPTLVPGATPGSEPTLALFYATSPDGVRFSPRQPVPTQGVPRHPQIALDARGAVTLSWDEAVSGSRRVALARETTSREGTRQFTRQAIEAEGQAAYPVIAGADAGVVVAWAGSAGAQGVIRARRAE